MSSLQLLDRDFDMTESKKLNLCACSSRDGSKTGRPRPYPPPIQNPAPVGGPVGCFKLRNAEQHLNAICM